MSNGMANLAIIKELKKDKKLDPIIEEEGSKLRKLVTGNSNKKSRLLTYKELAILQTWVKDRFEYQSDDYVWEKSDHWDTTAWIEVMLAKRIHWKGHLEGKAGSDCDFFGYAVLGILYYIFGYSRNQLERVACRTETGEGHFVAWITSEGGVVYQMENRVQKPRSVKYMRDKGYEYMHYSKMTNVDRWYKANKRAAEIIYNTPSGLASDEAEFTIDKATAITKSKTLVKEWFQIASGSAITAVSVIKSNPEAIATTLSANKSDLSQFIGVEYIGLFVALLGFIGVYLRTITNKDVDNKIDYEG